MRRGSVLVLALLALAACGAAGGASSSGLRGTVTRGPMQPLCRVGASCTAPAAHVLLVFRRGGVAVRTRTDSSGRYRVRLAAGRWQLRLAHPGPGSISPASVRVVAGRVRSVDVAIDTGIR